MKRLSPLKSFSHSLFALLACCCVIKTHASDAKPSNAQSGIQSAFLFGVARMSDIAQNSLYFKDLQNLVTEKRQALDKKFLAVRKSLENKAKKIQSLVKSGVNPDKIRAQQIELQKEASGAEKSFQQELVSIQNFQQGHTLEVLRQLRLIFKTVGEKNKLSIVFDSDSTLYVNLDQAVDVTAEVLSQLNANYDKKVFKNAGASVKPSQKEVSKSAPSA